MGSLYLTDMADWLRAAGVKVVEFEGWKARSRSSGGYDTGRPWGVMWHHTASSTSPQNDADYMCNGSPDRPIANLLVARDGTVWVLAAGATNTNGKGSGVVWSRGRVPDDSMNTYAVGVEIANSGVGESYPVAQIDGAFAASIALCEALGLAASDVSEHNSWAPDRKIDPATAAAVQGPWRPASCTSSGTWELSDLVAEHVKRSGTAPPTPTPPPEDTEMATQPRMMLAPNDGNTSVAFCYGPEGIWHIPNAPARDAGLWLGWWQYDPATQGGLDQADPNNRLKGDYYRNFSTAQIQALINTCWCGAGEPPKGWSLPPGD